jgi:hypothetical protein
MIVMLTVALLSVVMLNVITLSVAMLNVITLSVIAPEKFLTLFCNDGGVL